MVEELLLKGKGGKVFMKCVDPCIIKTITLGSDTYLVNDKNYLKKFSDWDERIRDWLASAEQIKLSSEHLHILDLLRNLYAKNGKHPVLRMITTDMASRFGAEKGTVKYFHTLFPGGIHQAFVIAGLPMQDSCC